MKQHVIDCFEFYKESIFNIDNDLRFWKSFLKSSINQYPKKDDRDINIAIFCAYDYQHDNINGILKSHKKVYKIKTSELETKRIEFFNWIMNLSILKAYNSLEILILQSIQIAYFPSMPNPIEGKKQNDKIQKKIKDFLETSSIKINTKNNAHIVQFLRIKCSKLDCFFNLPMNVDLTTKWVDFFNFISILRNIVAHCGMIVQPDIHNEIKSKAKDIFERYFEIKQNVNGLPTLIPKNEEFTNFLNYINSLSVSIYKFVFNENDLTFIGLK